MYFLMIEQRLSIIKCLATIASKALKPPSDYQVECDVFEVGLHDFMQRCLLIAIALLYWWFIYVWVQ